MGSPMLTTFVPKFREICVVFLETSETLEGDPVEIKLNFFISLIEKLYNTYQRDNTPMLQRNISYQYALHHFFVKKQNFVCFSA